MLNRSDHQPRPTLAVPSSNRARKAGMKSLPAGVCARWAAFVAEKGAVQALTRIVESSDSLLEQLAYQPETARHALIARAQAPEAGQHIASAWRMGAGVP